MLRCSAEMSRGVMERWWIWALMVACVCWPGNARADLGVMIADPTNMGSSAFTHAGHALVYMSAVCAETPVRARLCDTGEQGSVVTAFPNFKELQPYRWNMIPLSLYLEGSMTPGERLLYGSHAVGDALEERTRTEYLGGVCGAACPMESHSYWRDGVATTIDRDVFVYAVKTTREQDEAVVKWLNAEPNVNHYNGMTNNCAVFTRALMNLVFPHSVHRDFLNDLGMMSPKSAARSFSHWSQRRPELGFYSMHFPQKPGSLPRSGTASSGTETAIHIKKYLIAAALIGDHEVAGSFFVAYFFTGRFSLYKEYERYSTPELTTLEAEKKDSDGEDLKAIDEEIKSKEGEATGTEEEWAAYRKQFAAMSEATGWATKARRKEMLKVLDCGTVAVDEGGAWLTEGGRRVGIVSSNVLAAGSDKDLALDLLSWRIGVALAAKGRMRPGIVEFREDWGLFEQAYTRGRLVGTVGIGGDMNEGLSKY
jgi:hypothetical protein